MIKHPYDNWLDKITNPSQYLGGEVNSVIKDASRIDCRVALCFPELYTIAMSNLGLKILYSVVNSFDNLWGERVFAPEPDMEAMLREMDEPLRSLESHDPLSAFDLVGFSISTELCFTEILTMLNLGGVPIRQKDRSESDPLVIGGGASIYNPEPVADFFDLFLLGEGEEALPLICQKVASFKGKNLGRADKLKELANIKGVYVPSLYSVTYDGAKIKEVMPIADNLPEPERVYIESLNDSPYPFDMVIPYGQPVFDRLAVEVDRGCTVGCRFCQAGTTYRPLRERDPKQVVAIAEEGLQRTGFDDLSLSSLSSGDHSNIEPLVKELMDRTEKDRVSLSLPSLRSGTLTDELIKQISRVRQTGFTITAEAGSERLRRVINKKITDDEILETARRVLAGGWRNLKLYFMIGLPTETDEDINDILELIKKIDGLKENGKHFARINVGVSQFVPKSFTPFQWFPMDSVEEMLRKKMVLLHAIKRMKHVSLKGHSVEMSFLEAVFARGDRRLSAVIENAYNKGCRLDGWSDQFRYDYWLEAFEEAGIQPEEVTTRNRAKEEILPWDHLKVGVTRKFLWREWLLAEKEETTDDCRDGNCLGCGLPANCQTIAEPYELEKLLETIEKPIEEKTVFRYRITFNKINSARYLSHIDLKTAFARAVKRANLPISFSIGMHPHPKFSFGPAVSVGVASLCEIIDMDLDVELDVGEVMGKINEQLEDGLEIYEVKRINRPYKSIQAATVRTIYRLSYHAPTADAIPIETVKSALEEVKDMKVTLEESDGVKELVIDSPTPGVLSKIRKALPDFVLGNGIALTKSELVMD